jgi:hypothetical protein
MMNKNAWEESILRLLVRERAVGHAANANAWDDNRLRSGAKRESSLQQDDINVLLTATFLRFNRALNITSDGNNSLKPSDQILALLGDRNKFGDGFSAFRNHHGDAILYELQESFDSDF